MHLIALIILITAGPFDFRPTCTQEIIENSIGMKLRRIEAGTFISNQGYDSERTIEVSQPFYIGVFEVTQEQFQRIMGLNPSQFIGPDRPVERVSYIDAAEFCVKLSEREGASYRLPTEAEWEYAARAGTTAEFYWDNEEPGAYAWYFDNSGDHTHPVGMRLPNAWGLYDMVGNVWEWCGDWWDADYPEYAPRVDPGGPESGSRRVIRGASWQEPAVNLTFAQRGESKPETASNVIGFRVVCGIR